MSLKDNLSEMIGITPMTEEELSDVYHDYEVATRKRRRALAAKIKRRAVKAAEKKRQREGS